MKKDSVKYTIGNLIGLTYLDHWHKAVKAGLSLEAYDAVYAVLRSLDSILQDKK